MGMYPRIPLQTLILYEGVDLSTLMYWPDETSKTDFIEYFQLEYGEFTPSYQVPDLLKKHISAVSASLKNTIDKLYASTLLTYAPLENYDRAESWTESGTSSETRTPNLTRGETSSETRTPNLTRGETTSGTKTTSGGYTDADAAHTTELQIAADNTSTYYPSEKNIDDGKSTTRTYSSLADTTSGTSSTTETGTETKAGTRSETETGTDAKAGSTGLTHTGRIHGNIGVTTSQQMLESERQVALFDLMDTVAYLYAKRLLILIL